MVYRNLNVPQVFFCFFFITQEKKATKRKRNDILYSSTYISLNNSLHKTLFKSSPGDVLHKTYSMKLHTL